MKIALFGIGAAATFVLGFECGGNYVQKKIQKRLMDAIPLMASGLASIHKRHAAENLSEEELNRLFQEQFEFMKIVIE